MKRTVVLLLASFLLVTCSKSSSTNTTNQTDCAATLAGTYSGVDFCSGSGQIPYPANITATTLNNIIISNLYGVTVNGTVDCQHSTITIPAQTSGNFSISGAGSYTATRININWTAYNYGVPINCSTIYTR